MNAIQTPFRGALVGLFFAGSLAAAPKPASFHKEIAPIFRRSCNGCHHPGKLKGNLDLTSYEAFKKGGKHGSSFKPGNPKDSLVIEEISGKEPSMPAEGAPLSTAEVALFERWIKEGAHDDTPAGFAKPTAPLAYPAAPAIPALAFSPDGSFLAVAAHHEIILHKADGSAIAARLPGDAARIESFAFSPDGKYLAAAGGSPGLFGEVQIWEMPAGKLAKSFRFGRDSLFGVNWSPDQQSLVCGSAERTVRVIAVADGKELFKFDNHTDWTFGGAFTLDGKHFVSGGRDRVLKLVDIAKKEFISDLHPSAEPITCLARHPAKDQIAFGSAQGSLFLYQVTNQVDRTAVEKNTYRIRSYNRLPIATTALAFNADGTLLAAGGAAGDCRIYRTEDGTQLTTLKGHDGPVFALAFHPKLPHIAAGGFDGHLRLFNTTNGTNLITFSPVPLKTPIKTASGSKESKR